MAESHSLLHNLVDNVGVKYIEDVDSNYSNHQQITHNNKGKEAMSARTLAATLWEINGLHSPSGLKKEISEEEPTRSRKSSQRIAKLLRSDPHSPLHDQLSDGSKVRGHRRRSSATSQKLEITEYIAETAVQETVGGANSIEVSSPIAGSRDANFSIKTRLKDVKNSLIASKELVKVLFRFLSQEEQHSSRITLVSALRVELDRARLQIDKLIQEQRTNSNQMDDLLKHFAEENAARRSKDRERIVETVSSLAREIEIERKLRKQSERLNKKLGKELADTKAHFSRALKDLDGERRAREILEQTCDELARGIGEERAEMEELKRESEKAREEVEKERQMLQLADVLREERVQMKLAEAKYEYEEKNAALERLKSETETYFKTKEIEDYEHEEGDVDDGEDTKRDSGDSSELHSIELNMENNRNYKWSFACDENNKAVQVQGESRRASMDEMFKGRRSLSEKIQWENICLQRKTLDGSIEWDFTPSGNNNKKQTKNINGMSSQISHDCEENGNETDDGGFKRFKPASKSRRLPLRQGSESPAISTGNSLYLREACSVILQDLASKGEQLEGNGWLNIK